MQMSDIVLRHTTKNLDGESISGGAYGPELLLDCHYCDTSTFTRKSIKGYMRALCKAIDMKRHQLHFYKEEGGWSAVQFIMTSAIVVHTRDSLEAVYVDIFSCKVFNDSAAVHVTQEWFKAKSIGTHLIQRG